MATVSLSSLQKIYPGTRKTEPFEAVKSIDLEINDREFMVLVGPSGCGKSTTIRMIAGLEEITSGSIRIEDRVVNDVRPKDRDIAMVFQNYALYPHMTIYENMAFGLKLRKYSKEEIESRVNDAAKMLGLDELLHRKPKALSGGQRQRVALGRAIVRKPKVFLFDEPLSNLDAKMRVSTRTELSKLHTRLDATMIYVTHDQVEAMTMGDRICVMNAGEIMQVAKPIELYNKPASLFVASFIGSPPMNLIEGSISSENGSLKFVESSEEPTRLVIQLDERLSSLIENFEGKSVFFGIRPEDVVVTEDSGNASGEKNTAMLEVVEPMGSETYNHLRTPTAPIIARTSPESNHKVGRQINVSFNLDKAHFFDAATENRID